MHRTCPRGTTHRLEGLLGLLLAIVILGMAWSRPAYAQALIDDDLSTILQDSQPGELIPILIYLQEEELPPSRSPVLTPMSLERRRAFVRAELKAIAQRAQQGLMEHLESLATQGLAGEIRSLWLVNGIAVDVAAEEVGPLADFMEIRRISWDPEVPLDEMSDATPLPGDRFLTPTIPWNVDKVRAPQCWAAGYDGTGVLVGVIDSGVDYNHPDLADHMWINPNEVPGDTLDNDNNGKIDDVRGWDFVDNDNDPMDGDFAYHGTAVAGIVAGDGTSGTATGIAPGATLLPIRAAGGQWSAVFAALDYAVDMNVDVIQMSLSEKWRNNPKPDYAAWRSVTDNELALGYLHANSIGNEGMNQHSDPIPYNISTPGNCPSPWLSPYQYQVGNASSVVAVGAITQQDYADDATSRGPAAWDDIAMKVPDYPYPMPDEYQDYPYTPASNLEPGLIKPDLCAPGPGAMSLNFGSGYRAFSGTSAATPHVAGAMAILLQARPDLTPEMADMLLETTAVDLGAPGKDNIHGAGRLDCYAALQKLLTLNEYSYLQGMVLNSVTLDSLPGASIAVVSLQTQTTTVNSAGAYRRHLHAAHYSVIASAFGYEPDTLVVDLPGDTTWVHDFLLDRLTNGGITGVIRTTLGDTLSDVRVRVKNSPLATQITGIDGRYDLQQLPIGLPLTLEFVKFNHAVVNETVTLAYTPDSLGYDPPDTLNVTLPYGLHDDFELDQGWTLDTTDTAVNGKWERGDPVATFDGATMVQPEDDASANGTQCFLTQNNAPGAGEDFSEVDGGVTTLVSPIFDATPYHHPILNYRRWYSNNTGTRTDDSLRVEISSDAGTSWQTLELLIASDRNWTLKSYQLDQLLAVTESMRFRIKAWDRKGPSIVEAALDEVYITENTTDVDDDPTAGRAIAFELSPSAPNPLAGGGFTRIRFSLPRSAPAQLSIFDVQGRRVIDLVDGIMRPGSYVATWDGRDRAGHRCGAGLYLYRLRQGDQRDEGRIVLIR